MTDLNALADRVEEARGGDRELDADILAAVLPDEFQKLRIEAGMPSGAPDAVMTSGARDLVHYRSRFWFTSSLDAAMTLIPGSAEWSVSGWPEPSVIHGQPATAWVSGAARVYAATPALALTCACLRARATGGSHG